VAGWMAIGHRKNLAGSGTGAGDFARSVVSARNVRSAKAPGQTVTTEEARQKVRELNALVNASAVRRCATPPTVKRTMTGAPHVAIWILPLQRWQNCSAIATAPLCSGAQAGS
jgi:hypothetical protein